MILYTTNDVFIIATPGCLSTAPESQESMMVGQSAGATGSLVELDLTTDSMAVLTDADGCVTARDGNRIAVSDCDFAQLREQFNKVVTLGQAMELAKSWGQIFAVRLHRPHAADILKTTLRYGDYQGRALVMGLAAEKALEVQKRYGEMHVMLDVTAPVSHVTTFVDQVHEAGLYGIMSPPDYLTQEMCQAAHRVGLFVGVTQTDEPELLQTYIDWGVNFILTSRPDLACAMLPQGMEEQQTLFVR